MRYLPPRAASGALAIASTLLSATYKIEPGQLSPGTTYTLTVVQDGCKEGDAEATLKSAVLKASLTGLAIPARAASTLGCAAAWQAEVGTAAPLGPTSLQLLDKEGGSVLALLKVDIIPVAGPTPPGMERQVDVMWKVLPYRNVADSFGKKVAAQYFAIQVVVGNNSGYPIQFTSVGFRSSNGKPPMPNDPYNLARSTIEREQQVGTRAIARHGIEAAAGLAAAASGFVTARARDDYRLALGLANPVALGFDLVWPDKTVRHLVAMDTRAFRDGVVVPNNVPSPPILAFMSRDLVECKKGKCNPETCAQPKPAPAKNEAGACGLIERIPYNRKDFNPKEIMDRLGELVLTGQQIQYLPRVNVSGNRITPAPVPPVLGVLGSDREVKQGAKGHTLRIPGNGLLKGDVTPMANSGVTVKSSTVDAHGTSITVVLDVADDAPLGETAIAVSTGVGPSQIAQIKINPAAPVIAALTPASEAQAGKKQVTLLAAGSFVKGAEFSTGGTRLASTAKADGTVEVTLPLDERSEPRVFPIVASRNGLSSAPRNFELTAAKPEVEAPRPAAAKKDGATAPVEVKILGNYLASVKVTPEANSGLKVTDVRAAEASGQSKREELAFKLDLSGAAKGKWKLTIDNRGQQVQAEFEVQ